MAVLQMSSVVCIDIACLPVQVLALKDTNNGYQVRWLPALLMASAGFVELWMMSIGL